MPSHAYMVHTLPGRTRLRIPARRGDRAFFAEVADRLERSSGVARVDSNPLTGSLLVHHEGDADDLAKILLGPGLGELLELVLHAPPVARRLRAEIMTIDERIRRLTGEELDLGTLTSLGLLAMAGLLLWRGRQPSGAVSLAWYATELLRRGSALPSASGASD